MDRNRLMIDMKRMDALPTLPVVAVELLSLTLNDDTSIDKISRLISTDQALTVKILKVVNSPFYRRERQLTNLPDAIVLLGRKALRSLVLSITVFDLFESGESQKGLNPGRLWTHCLAVAQGAKAIATRLGAPNPEDCFVAGLLHDVGKLVLAHLYPEQYTAVLELARHERRDILNAEASLLDVDHVTVGKWALERWNLPQQFVEAVWLHHSNLNGEAEVGSGPWMGAVVAVCDGLFNGEGYTSDDEVPSLPVDETTRQLLGLSEVELVEVADVIATELPRLTSSLQLPAPSRKTYLNYLQRSNLELGKISLEHQQQKDALELRNHDVTNLASMAADLHTTSEIDELAKVLIAAALRGLQVERASCTIGLGKQAVLVAQVSWQEDDDIRPRVTVDQGDGKETDHHAGSTAHVELVCNGKFHGYLAVWRGEASPPRDDLAPALATYANIGALAIDQILTRCQLEDRTEELIAASRRLVRSEDQLAVAQRQIQRIERLKVMGELTAGVLHDFNNALSVLLGRAQLFLLDCKDEKLRTHAEIIGKVALDATAIVSQLGRYGKDQWDDKPVRLDMNAVVQDLLAILEARLTRVRPEEGRIEVALELGRVRPIAGVASYLREALTNLVLNAVDAMPRGGRLTISTFEESGNIVLELTDTGVGMSPETLQNVFKPFFTTKGDAGTGVGLSVTQGLITRLHGSIAMKSTEGVGTTASLKFPAATDSTPQPRSAEAPAKAARNAKILVMERDEQMRELIHDILVGQGHEVHVEAGGDGEEQHPDRSGYDLVISGMENGQEELFKLVSSIKANTPTCRVLVVSNGQALPDAKKAAEASIDQIIQKPFDINQLLNAVASLISE